MLELGLGSKRLVVDILAVVVDSKRLAVGILAVVVDSIRLVAGTQVVGLGNKQLVEPGVVHTLGLVPSKRPRIAVREHRMGFRRSLLLHRACACTQLD